MTKIKTRVPERIPALCLNPPHGSELFSQKRDGLITADKIEFSKDNNRWIGVIEDQQLLGIVQVDHATPIDPDEASRYFKIHGVSDEEIGKRWPDANRLYIYQVTQLLKYPTPIKIDIGPGVKDMIEIDVPHIETLEKSLEMPVITVLGSKGMIEEKSRKYASVLIKENGFRLRIDKGDNDGVEHDALIVTHAHPDHIGGVQKDELFFATADVAKVFDGRVLPLRMYAGTNIGHFMVFAFPVMHSIKAPSCAIRVEGERFTAVYAPDILDFYTKQDRHACLDGADIYFGDGSKVEGIVRRVGDALIGHASWKRQLRWAQESGVKQVVFTHLGEETLAMLKSGDLDQTIKDLSAEYGINISIAEDGLDFVIPEKLEGPGLHDTRLDKPQENWRELFADLRFLANSGYVRLKSGRGWGEWTIKDVAKRFGEIVDALRSVYFPIVPPSKGDPRYHTPYWELYRLAEREGYIKSKPPNDEEVKEWDEKRAVVIKGDMERIYTKLPDSFLVIPEWASLTGSSVYGDHAPNDIDIVIRGSLAPSGSVLKIQRALHDLSIPVQFIFDDTGPTWDYLPLYDLVAVKAPFGIRKVRESAEARKLLYKSLETKPEQAKPGTPIVHYDVAGEFYIPDEIRLAWEKWAKKHAEKGEAICINPKHDGIRFIVEWDGKKLYVFTSKGENRAHVFPGLEKLFSKIGAPFIMDTEFVEFDSNFKHQLSRTLMTWMAVGQQVMKKGSHVKIFVHDLVYFNGKNISEKPYIERIELVQDLLKNPLRDKRFMIEATENYTVTNFEAFRDAILEVAKPKVGRSTEGAMAKVSSFQYAPEVARNSVIKLKNRIEIDALIIGYRELPESKPEHKKLSAEEARQLLGKRTGKYMFRMALLDEKTGKLVPIESRKKLTETDLAIAWNEEHQRWDGTDDPNEWKMFFGFEHREKGEFAYGNSYVVACDSPPRPGAIVTISPMEVTAWEDKQGVHISFQHPIVVGLKEPGSPIGTIQSAFVAHGKVLPQEKFAVLIDRP